MHHAGCRVVEVADAVHGTLVPLRVLAPTMATQHPDFAPARDPAGFDRAAFQPLLSATIESFLRRAL